MATSTKGKVTAIIVLVALIVIVALFILIEFIYTGPKDGFTMLPTLSHIKKERFATDPICDCSAVAQANQVYKMAINLETGRALKIEPINAATCGSSGICDMYVYYSLVPDDTAVPDTWVLTVDASETTPSLMLLARGLNIDLQTWKLVENGDTPTDLQPTTSTAAASTSTPAPPPAPAPTLPPYSKKMYYLQSTVFPDHVLIHEHGNISLRLKGSTFTGEKWILSTQEYKSGIKTSNTANDPVQSIPINTQTTLTNDLSDQNQQKISDVLNLIKTNLQAYATTAPPVASTSTLGIGDNPIKINLLVGGNSITEPFTNSPSTTKAAISTNRVLSLLDSYEAGKTSQSINNIVNQNTSCPQINMNDYTNKVVGQCNCSV